MSVLQVGLGPRSYPIFIEPGVLGRVAAGLGAGHPASRYCIIADDTVAGLYGEGLQRSLQAAGLACDLLTFAPGEDHKHLGTVAALLSRAAAAGLDRGSLIIALGGGVTGDIAGFVAATYMRGIPFIQIPTSLLAQVDSSVGGKTGVDIPEGKNLVGAFYQPRAVYIDPEVLRSLPERQYVNGLAEVIKHGIIRDAGYFRMLGERFDQVMAREPVVLEELIRVSCRIKAEVVAGDERESDSRRILNFGHTIGHAVEAASRFAIPHGFAVAIGMVAAARIAVRKGLLAPDRLEAITGLLSRYGLPTEVPGNLDRKLITAYLQTDKKRVGTTISFVLAVDIGAVIITEDVGAGEIAAVLDYRPPATSST